MKSCLMEQGWIQKTVRIKDDYNKLCAFLELYAKGIGIDSKRIYDEIFRYSIDELLIRGFHYRFVFYPGRREPKGFLIDPQTLDKIEDSFPRYSAISYKLERKKILVAEFYELLLYIYAMNKLEEQHLKYLNETLEIDWGIESM